MGMKTLLITIIHNTIAFVQGHIGQEPQDGSIHCQSLLCSAGREWQDCVLLLWGQCKEGAPWQEVRRREDRQGAGEEKVTPLEIHKFHQTPCWFSPEGWNSQQSTEVWCGAGSPGPAAIYLTGGSRGALLALNINLLQCHSSWSKE